MRSWTWFDDSRLRDWFRGGVKFSVMDRRLSRPRGSSQRRASRLGLRRRDTARLRRRVAALVAKGLSDRQAAARLGVSSAAVFYHRKLLGMPPVGKPGRKRQASC